MINRENLVKIGRAGGKTSNRETPNQIRRVGISVIACGECGWKWKMGDVVARFIMRKDNTLITALNCFWNKGKLIFNLSLPRIYRCEFSILNVIYFHTILSPVDQTSNILKLIFFFLCLKINYIDAIWKNYFLVLNGNVTKFKMYNYTR